MTKRKADERSRLIAAALDDISCKVRAGDVRWLEQDIKRWAQSIAHCDRIAL